MASQDVYSTIDKILRWITPLLATIISLAVFVYRSKVRDLEKKIELEKEERKEAVKDVIKLCSNCEEEYKKIDKDRAKIFSDEVRNEREWRITLVEKQSIQFGEIYDKLEDLNICINRVIEKVENYTNSQEKICNERHNLIKNIVDNYGKRNKE